MGGPRVHNLSLFVTLAMVRKKYKSPYEQERVKVEEMFKSIHSSEYSIG